MYDDMRTEPLYNKQNNRPGLQGYLVTGTVLSGRYKIDGILGHGGFGITYKAWDTVLENYVAIKEYYPANIANRGADGKSISVMTQNDQKEFEEGVERFLREARDVSKFNSYSNIVSIHDFFKENSTAYMVMEYLEGQTLKEYMDSKSVIDESFQLHIAFSVLEVLETIHKKGLVHRDISPDNIFICNNLNIKLIDFGAAKNDTQNDVKTVSVVLKKGYAPIEQYSAKSIVSPKIDIYAFGATMYYLLTGVMPVPSVDRVINDELKEPKMLNPSISDEWNKVILKCMEIKADDRYSSVEEIRQDLMGKGKKEEENKTEGKKTEEKKAEGKKTEDSKPQEKKEEDKKTEEKIIKEPAQERIFKDLDEDVKNNITVNNAKKNMSIVIKLVTALVIACFVIVAIFSPKGKNKKSNKTTNTEEITTEQVKTDATITEKVVDEEKKKANELDARPDESDADYHIEVSEDVGYFSGGASLFGGSYKGIVDKLEIDMEPMSIDRFNEIYGDLTADLFVDDLINDYDIEIYINQYYEGGSLLFFFYDNKLLECAYISKAKNVYPDGIVYAAESEFGEQSRIYRHYSIFEFDTSCYFQSYLFEDPKTFIEYYIQAYEMTDLSSFSGFNVLDNGFLYVDDSLFGKVYEKIINEIDIEKISTERIIEIYGTVLNEDIDYTGVFYRNDHYGDGIILLYFLDYKLYRVWFLKNVNSIQIDELLASCKNVFNSEPESIDNDNVTATFKKDNISYLYYTAYDDLTNKYYFIQNYTYSE